MPTKTRLDPTAGGDSPPAGQDGAQGSGRGDHSPSERAAPPAAADVAGFIDSLGALATHLQQREAFEAETRRGWARTGVVAALMLPLTALAFGSFGMVFAPTASAFTYASALYAATIATTGLASAVFLFAAATPWRKAPDSVDRVALRHEDSPLRDRIRITQWVLFDAAFQRFAYQERRVNADIAHGILGVAIAGVLSFALVPFFFASLPTPALTAAPAAMVVFLVLTLAVIMLTARTAKATFHLAQHYGRQVLAFDEDFGGFLPRAEKEHVQGVVARGGATGQSDA